jgi:hypothetical protein
VKGGGKGEHNGPTARPRPEVRHKERKSREAHGTRTGELKGGVKGRCVSSLSLGAPPPPPFPLHHLSSKNV